MEPHSSEPAAGIIPQPGDSPTDLSIADQLAESGAESSRVVELETINTELESERPSSRDPINLRNSQDPSQC
ncbi:hypothetical protein HYC85_029846 [Camellia sinensis]|uniref:Uncharacterized protein n=1 Tax=Camellia sinensis TaxID=4442 RepID=A0A7J7FZV6_CAMSI|nr:hypothetical protein HYC85_029846 [Camellia sinensis]